MAKSRQPIPARKIKLGQRVAVISVKDADCDHDVVWGSGVVTFTEPEGRTEVLFDGVPRSGGMFPNECIFAEETAE